MSRGTKENLLARVRRLRGQLDAVERALDVDAGDAEVLQLLAAVRGAVNAVTAEVIGGLVHRTVADGGTEEERARNADGLRNVVRTYLK